MRNGTKSEMKRMTISKKSNQIPSHGKKIIGVEKIKLINRLRAGHTLLTHGYLVEGLPVPPECKLCHSHAMTVKHLLRGPAPNLAFCYNYQPIFLKFVQNM